MQPWAVQSLLNHHAASRAIHQRSLCTGSSQAMPAIGGEKLFPSDCRENGAPVLPHDRLICIDCSYFHNTTCSRPQPIEKNEGWARVHPYFLCRVRGSRGKRGEELIQLRQALYALAGRIGRPRRSTTAFTACVVSTR